jgi:CubicO group peptidase (beta-lactamase class C family)
MTMSGPSTKNHIPAVSFAVVRNGTLEKLQSHGVANLEWNAAATDDTAYQLASATKPLTGTLSMLLVEQGKLSLDDGITRFFPEAPESWKTITPRHLVAHTSGLKEVDGENLETVEQVVKAAMQQPLNHEPGTKSAYGFTDYVVLTSLLKKASGKPYASLLRDAITGPLGMTATVFNNATESGPIRVADPLPRRAVVYRWEAGAQKVFDFLYRIPGYTAGGLHSSAADLAKFFIALDEDRLLKPGSLETMWTRPRLTAGREGEFGLGWVVSTHQGRKVVGHSGGPALADLLYFPQERLAIVVLTNQQKMFPYLAEGISDLILPPAPLPKAIGDRDPELTARLRTVLTDAAGGKVNPDLIAEDAAGFPTGAPA